MVHIMQTRSLWRRLGVAAISRAKRRLPAACWADALAAILDSVFQRGRFPRFRSPKMFNDHLLKLRADGSLLDPLRQFVTDKEHMKSYVAGAVGTRYVLETFAVLHAEHELDELRLSRFPCVIKPTHMSGPVVICLDAQTPVDRALLRRWLHTDYYKEKREANYRHLRPKIIVEEYFSRDGRTPPRDYKIFCGFGRPRLIQVDADRFRNHTRNVYDLEWNRLPMTIKYPAGTEDDPKPPRLDEMIDVARLLAQPFTSIRVDLYADERAVKVGELTSCHGGGTELIQPAAAEAWLGEMFT